MIQANLGTNQVRNSHNLTLSGSLGNNSSLICFQLNTAPDGDGGKDGGCGDGECEARDDGGKVLVDAGGALLLVDEPVRRGRRQAVGARAQLPAAEE